VKEGKIWAGLDRMVGLIAGNFVPNDSVSRPRADLNQIYVLATFYERG